MCLLSFLEATLATRRTGKSRTRYDFDDGFSHTFLSKLLLDASNSRQAHGPQDARLTKDAETFEWAEGPLAIRPRGEK
jgi:hypothetical protein